MCPKGGKIKEVISGIASVYCLEITVGHIKGKGDPSGAQSPFE